MLIISKLKKPLKNYLRKKVKKTVDLVAGIRYDVINPKEKPLMDNRSILNEFSYSLIFIVKETRIHQIKIRSKVSEANQTR